MTTNKFLIALFSCALMAGCASNQTEDSGETSTAETTTSAAPETTAPEEPAATETEAAVTLETVFYFDFDQATLTADTRAALDAQAAALKGSNSQVRLEGHADERGTRDYNMALGERRANAVANYLIINGVERYRIEVVSYGEERPVAEGKDEMSYAKNRRVELK